MGKEPFNRISSIVGIIVDGIGGGYSTAATEFKMFQMKAIYTMSVCVCVLSIHLLFYLHYCPFHPTNPINISFLANSSLSLSLPRSIHVWIHTHLIICFFENDYQIQKDLFGKSFNLHPQFGSSFSKSLEIFSSKIAFSTNTRTSNTYVHCAHTACIHRCT